MNNYGLLEQNGVLVDELENELDVLEFPISDYAFKFTLSSVLKNRKFSHLSIMDT